MIDREMLELAAKAAGYEVEVDHKGVFHIHEGTGSQSWRPWNPLDDDGDALRLAVKLGLDIEMQEDCVYANGFGVQNYQLFEWHNNDPYAATRRAIVKAAAAEIGKGMK